MRHVIADKVECVFPMAVVSKLPMRNSDQMTTRKTRPTLWSCPRLQKSVSVSSIANWPCPRSLNWQFRIVLSGRLCWDIPWYDLRQVMITLYKTSAGTRNRADSYPEENIRGNISFLGIQFLRLRRYYLSSPPKQNSTGLMCCSILVYPSIKSGLYF